MILDPPGHIYGVLDYSHDICAATRSNCFDGCKAPVAMARVLGWPIALCHILLMVVEQDARSSAAERHLRTERVILQDISTVQSEMCALLVIAWVEMPLH